MVYFLLILPVHQQSSGEIYSNFSFTSTSSWSTPQLNEFARAGVTKYDKPDSLKQQKCIVSKLWRPEVQNQGTFRASFSLKLAEFCFALFCFAFPSFSCLLARNRWCSLICRWITPISFCLHNMFSPGCLFLVLIRTPAILN